MKRTKPSVDLCQGEGCICFEIKKKPRIIMHTLELTNGIKQIYTFPAPPPVAPPQMLIAIAREERRRELWEGNRR